LRYTIRIIHARRMNNCVTDCKINPKGYSVTIIIPWDLLCRFDPAERSRNCAQVLSCRCNFVCCGIGAVSLKLSLLERVLFREVKMTFPEACATIGSCKMREDLEVGTSIDLRRLSSFPLYN